LFLLALSVKTFFSRVSCIIAFYEMRVKDKDVDATLQTSVQNVPKKSNNVTANLSYDPLEAQISVSYLKMLGYFFLPTLHEKLESAHKVKGFGRNVRVLK
jgi:hypothetical protein